MNELLKVTEKWSKSAGGIPSQQHQKIKSSLEKVEVDEVGTLE